MIIEAYILANLPKYPPLYICQEASTNQPLIMQNKANQTQFSKGQNGILLIFDKSRRIYYKVSKKDTILWKTGKHREQL